MAYLPLSTANLPDPVIDPAQGASPEDYFNTVLYTGDGTTSNAITGVGYQPDLTWIKSRSASYNNYLIDAVRGSGYELISNNTNAEAATTKFVSFDADGFTVANVGGNALNANGATYVGWNWKANGSGVSNTDGSITSTVSANTTSGFSIVSYTGTGSNATVGHGLSSAPEMVIVKGRNVASTNWFIYTATQGATKYLDFSTGTGGTDSTSWNNTAPTSSVFSVGSSYYTNYSATTYIAYCFHSVEGFSKIGSYVGNGSTDGPFVYTGFRPAFVMVKRTDSNDRWFMGDSTRSPTNTSDGIRLLDASGSDAEFANSPAEDYDMLSNGFKINTSDAGINASGGTYIYMAFAEQPIKFSNAR